AARMKYMCAAALVVAVGYAGAERQMPAGAEMHGGGAAFLTITPARAVELGGEDIQRFYDGDEVALWTQMSAAMRAAVESQDVLKNFTEHMAKNFGTEAQVIHQDAVLAPPAADSKYVEYRDRTKLEFPLRGEWTIYQGGRMVPENEHATTKNERFAYEMVRLDTGQMFTHNGATNEEWFSFGQPVLADANGTVVKVMDDYLDNAPYHPDADAKHGNVVEIDHGDGEFSVYSHLKHGSVRVKMGDRVKAGEKIAEVGNSGDMQFPRLEYSLQTSADLNGSEGLPAAFTRLKVNGKRAKEVELVRGDVVNR